MPALSILVRLDRVANLETNPIKRRLAAIGQASGLIHRVNIVEGEEDGGYINATYTAGDLKAVWRIARSELAAGADGGQSLLGCSIVVCTGKFGWDDYLLLHHFRESEILDNLE